MLVFGLQKHKHVSPFFFLCLKMMEDADEVFGLICQWQSNIKRLSYMYFFVCVAFHRLASVADYLNF